MSAAPSVLRSALFERHAPGAVHGFTTRSGGISGGPYASLNLGRATGDDDRAVAENHRRLAEHAGFDLARLATPARQVHGAGVVRAEKPAHAETDCDAIVTGERGLAIGIRTADCVPLLLYAPAAARGGAIHAGWRGVAAGVVAAGVQAMEVPSGELIAAIGPSIGGCCYEVDDATLARVRAAAPETTVTPTRPGHARIDLVAGVRGQLRAAGVPDSSIEIVGGCTSCDPALFFSHRRDKGTTGRHLAFLLRRP